MLEFHLGSQSSWQVESLSANTRENPGSNPRTQHGTSRMAGFLAILLTAGRTHYET